MDNAGDERDDVTIFAPTNAAAGGRHLGSPLEVLLVF